MVLFWNSNSITIVLVSHFSSFMWAIKFFIIKLVAAHKPPVIFMANSLMIW